MIPRLLQATAACFAAILIASASARAEDTLRFLVVTHGAATDKFWSTVKDGAEAAAKDANVSVEYRAPESFDLNKMTALVEAAVKEKPDGLVVSIPNADAVAAPIREAIDAGIPVITINSGFDVGRSLGALLHVGQGEYEAGQVAGDTMRKLGGTKALCLNHELGNVALDLRCKGFIDGFAGSVEVLPLEADAAKAEETIAGRLKDDAEIDTILALSATAAGEPAVAAVKALAEEAAKAGAEAAAKNPPENPTEDAGAAAKPEPRKVLVGTFDITDQMLADVADGDAAFAIDQQPFLQGYLPVEFLALLKRRGVIPVSNVSTGPRLVTQAEARRQLGREEGSDAAGAPADGSAPDEAGAAAGAASNGGG